MTIETAPIGEVREEPSRSPLAFLGWLVFSVLLFYALAIGGGWLGMYVGPMRLLNLAIIAVALVSWLILAWRRPEWRPTTAIWPAFAAPLGAFALSISFSEHRSIGLDFLSYALLLTALYLLLVRIIARPYARARIGGVMAVITLVMGSAYILWSLQLWMEWWDLLGELRMPFLRPALLGMGWGSPSVTFTVLTLMTSVSIGGLGLGTRGRQITVAVLVVLLAVAGFISGSRSGWLAISGAIVIVGALGLADSHGRALIARAWGQRAFRIALIPVAAVVGLAAVLLGPLVLDRMTQGDAGRPELWATTLRMIEDAPLVGFGPGSWMIRRVAYQEAGELNWYQPHAHNQYLQTAAEFGIVGLVAGTIAFGAVAWLLYRAIRGDDPVRRRWAWASLFGLTYLALNVVVDTHTIPTVALLMGLPIAVLDATSREGIGLPFVPRRVACWLRNLAVVLLVLACLASMQQLIRSESVAMTHQEAVAAVSEGEWADALGPAREAVRSAPEVGAYGMTLALALAAEGDWSGAEQAYQAVVDIDQFPMAWLGLARARAELGRPAEDVESALTEALRLGEQEFALVLAAGQVYDMIGQVEEADAAYVDTLVAGPSMAYDERWRAELGTERFGRIVDAAIESAPGKDWEIALMAGQANRALELAFVSDDAEWRTAYIEAWEGDEAAYRTIQGLTEAALTDVGRLAPAARLADHLGDIESARRYRRLKQLGPYYGPPTINVGFDLRQPSGDDTAGTWSHDYGTYTYRRSLRLDLLPSGLPGMVLVTSDVGDEADDDSDGE